MRLPQHILRNRLSALAAALTLCFCRIELTSIADAPTGEQIYKDQCARCHGKSGEGTDDNYPDPLEGDKSVAQLTKLIHETMPDDADTKTSADDSAKVADYIYDTFYSPEARARNKPARIELSRLTVRQYQNAVADLVGSFRPAADGAPSAACAASTTSRATSAATRRSTSSASTRKSTSTSATPAPTRRSSKPHEFSIGWEGSVLAPETGEYEFVVRTEHAARLWVNDTETAADRRLGEVGRRHRAPRRRSACSAAVPTRSSCEFSKAKPGRQRQEKTTKVSTSRRHKALIVAWRGNARTTRSKSSRRAACRPATSPEAVRRRRRASRRTTAASATSAARRSPRPGTRPRPTARSRSPATWPAPGKAGRRRTPTTPTA